MRDVLAPLVTEHANANQLLDILERQVDLIEAGARPDNDIVQGILDSFQSDQDLYHHPKEDLVLATLRRR